MPYIVVVLELNNENKANDAFKGHRLMMKYRIPLQYHIPLGKYAFPGILIIMVHLD